jgi:hypothetical protein
MQAIDIYPFGYATTASTALLIAGKALYIGLPRRELGANDAIS